MRGTGSHDVNVDDLFVPAERAVPFKPLEQPNPAYSGPWHRLTIWPSVAGAGITALGIAQAAIDEFAELATKKTPSYTTTMLKDRSIVQLRFAHGGRQGRIRASLSARGLRRRLASGAGRAVPRPGRQGAPAARVEPRADRGGRGRRPDSLARRYGRYSERSGVPAPFSRCPRHYPARVCLREPHGSGRPGPLRSRPELAVPAFLGSSRLRSSAFIERWAFADRVRPVDRYHASWSPDGQWMAFSSVRGGFKDEAALKPAGLGRSLRDACGRHRRASAHRQRVRRSYAGMGAGPAARSTIDRRGSGRSIRRPPFRGSIVEFTLHLEPIDSTNGFVAGCRRLDLARLSAPNAFPGNTAHQFVLRPE